MEFAQTAPSHSMPGGGRVPVRESFTVAIPGMGLEFDCTAGQTILKAMMSSGRRALPIGCRNGGCGVCRIRVLAGDHHTMPMSRDRVSQADEADGVRLACRVVPDGDLTIEPLPLGRLSAMIGGSA